MPSAALAPVPAPPGLLAQGAIRKPAELWRRAQAALEGPARLAPSSFALALCTVVLEAPLAVGLIDADAPVALASVLDGERGPGFVAGVRLTSGGELVALLTNGADAKFDADRASGGALTALRPRSPAGPLALGVAGDMLLLASSDALLRAGGSFVAHTVAPAIGDGAPMELVVQHDALAGPLAAALGANAGELSARFRAADAADRSAHGGRNPDFGDPGALIGALGSLADEGVALLRSAAEARMTASFDDAGIRVRIELAPEPSGALQELTTHLETGSIAPVLALPDWVDVAVFTPSSAPAGDQPLFARHIESVLGERLKGAGRDRLRAFFGDVDRGIGRARTAGLFDAGGVGVFAVGTGGDPAALRRAVEALPSVAAIPAVAAPLDAIAGRPIFTRQPVTPGVAARWAVRFGGPNNVRAPAEPLHIVASTAGERAAVVAAHGDTGPRLAALLAAGRATVSADPAVARSIERAGSGAAGAVLVHIRAEGDARRFAVLAFGSDRKATWAEVVMGEAAFRSVARAALGP